jgi:tetratricopeptide repeat protein
MLAERLLALTALAGRMVVVAAATDEWETARRGFAQLMGRGDAKQTRLTEAQLQATREQLIGAVGADAGVIRTTLARRWAGRLADLLEENPDAEAELQALVREIQAVPHAEVRSASSQAASTNGVASTNAAAEPAPEHPGALAARSELAYSTGQAGEAAAARDQFASLVPVAERVLGPEHPDTLTNRHNLANFAGYAGDATAARDQFARLLPVRERVFGADSPDTLAARFNLAYWTGRAGDAAAARDQFAELLPVRERVSGPDHPDTLATREELAYWTGYAGDPAAARDQFAALLLVRQRILSPEDAEILAIWYQLAYWTALAGDAAARD